MAETVFVTGGSGYIGRTLIRTLVAHGYEVRALARSDRAIAIVRVLGARAVGADLLDAGALRGGLTGCMGVIHAAADTGQGDGGPEQERINVEGTRLLMEVARDCGIGQAVHMSTEAVLADGNPIVNADETWPLPQSFAGSYSRTKAMAEEAALGESRGGSGGFTVCAIRPRLVWGRDDSSLLPKLVAAARSGKLKWIDGGHYLTSTAHVANVAAGAVAALIKGAAGQVYFITDGEPQDFREFVTALLETQGVPAPTESVSRWAVRSTLALGDLFGGVMRGAIRPPMSRQEYASIGQEVTVSDARARRELGYRPVISVRQGLAELREQFAERAAKAKAKAKAGKA